MHELSIAQEIINIVNDYIPEKDKSVKSVRIKVGKLSNILVDSLVFCFDALITDTYLAGSVLNVEETVITGRCRDCEFESVLDGINFSCSSCGSYNLELLSGRELQVMDIELNE